MKAAWAPPRRACWPISWWSTWSLRCASARRRRSRRSPRRPSARRAITSRLDRDGFPHPPGTEALVAKFKVVTPAGANFGAPGGNYTFELEALELLDAEIVEVDASSENAFISAAHDADALYSRGGKLTKRMIDGLERCKVISVGSVGVDAVEVAAATARGIPVTNVPDTFIEEVADHAMMLILASFRRLVFQDLLVRDGRWKAGRPAVCPVPRL